MSCENCRSALNLVPETGRAAAVNAVSEIPCFCESFSASPHSSGRVEDGEELNLLVTDPQHLLQDGALHPGLISRIDTSGVSVLRGAACDSEFRITYGLLAEASRAKGVPRYLHGICTFTARDVRYEGEKRLLCVYDTAYEDRPGHADLLAPRFPAGTSRGEIERFKKALVRRIGPTLVRIEKFRDGALADFARPSSV
jgi:hypothetical protein